MCAVSYVAVGGMSQSTMQGGLRHALSSRMVAKNPTGGIVEIDESARQSGNRRP